MPLVMPAPDSDGENTMTHIAAPHVNMDGRIIQRCIVCGAKLCDSNGVAMPLNKDGTLPTFPTWEAFALVQVEVGNPTRYSLLPQSDIIPADTCLEFA